MLQAGKKKRKAAAVANGTAAEQPPESQKLVVESYAPPDPGPYPADLPPQNPVRCTLLACKAEGPTELCLDAFGCACFPCWSPFSVVDWLADVDVCLCLLQVRFTAVQVEAVKSGVQKGLTLVVGPPGERASETNHLDMLSSFLPFHMHLIPC